MNPMIKYSLARLALFLGAAVVLIALPLPVDLFIRLAAAVLISAVLSFVLFKGMREEVAEHLAGTMQRRAEAKQRLRSALAGDDTPESD